MSEEKKSEKVKLHNKGKREFLLNGNIKSMPGRAIDVDVAVAEKMIKNYPRDFILYDDLVTPSSTKQQLKAAQKEAADLAAANEKLVAAADEQKTAVEESAEQLKAAQGEIDGMKKTAAEQEKEIKRLQEELKKATAAKGGA